MHKPTEGKWKCVACFETWNANQVTLHPDGRLCCGNFFCGGTVIRVDKSKELKILPTLQEAQDMLAEP